MILQLEDMIRDYNLKVGGILHVGAHLAEEAAEYARLDINNVYWVEGNVDNIPAIKRVAGQYGHCVICALITDRDRELTQFNITNYESMSSSVLEFGTHPTFSPDTIFVERRMVESRTLDSLGAEYEWFPGVNVLNMDLQGAELLALKGASQLLKRIDYVYTEVNRDEVYVGCAKVGELDEMLSDFERVQTGWVPRQGWGDALYVRNASC